MEEVVVPDDFLHFLRLSLKPSASLVKALANTGGAPQNGHIRKIIAAVLWHRKFIVTYYIWIIVVVAISCVHKTYKRRRHGKSNDKDGMSTGKTSPGASVSSSSSSTLTGRGTPPQKDFDLVNAATPLLSHADLSSNSRRPSIWNKVRCFLLYQPRPVPAVTSPVNTLPNNGTSLLILFFLALNLFYLFFRAPLSLQWIFILVDRAGLLFVTNLPVLYILAAKNNQPIKYLTGWSYEGLNIFHRRLGEWMTCFAVIHMLARPYVGVSLAIWVIDRGLWRIATSSRKFIATLEVAPDGQTVLLHADIPFYHKKNIPDNRPNLHYGWASGQHVFLTIPSMGLKYRFQAHPFTIASPAPPQISTSEQKSWPLQLTIRAIDGFSKDLLSYAQHHQHCEITLDGPYGSTSALVAAQKADRVCFIAGGSGIAVTYPLAWSARVRPQDNHKDAIVTTRTLYTNSARSPPPYTESCGALISTESYAHFWIRQDEQHDKWITMLPKASAVSQDSIPEAQKYPTRFARSYHVEEVAELVTKTFDTRAPGPEGGRPDMNSEVWEWVTSVDSAPSSLSETTLDGTGKSGKLASLPKRRERVCIIVSGPDGLVRDVRNVSAELFKRGWDIDVHVEKFGW